MVICGSLSVIGSKAIGYPSAGALGCITHAFVAGTGWRRQSGKESVSSIMHTSKIYFWSNKQIIQIFYL